MDKNEIVSRLGQAFGGDNKQTQKNEEKSSYREDTGSLVCVSQNDLKER